jgi:aspartate racemase
MKTIGLLGGMSWESTATYYRIINQGMLEKLGGLHSARIVLYSFDFQRIADMQAAGDWDGLADILCGAAENLESAGADFLLICTNTMHKIAPQIEEYVDIPLLHIADATADSLQRAGIATVGLLGTRFTMEQEFYRERLAQNHGLEVLVPEQGDRDVIDRIIFSELCRGCFEEASRQECLRIVEGLARRGAQGIVLGCTEIPLLLQQSDTAVPLFDTASLHAWKAVEEALS